MALYSHDTLGLGHLRRNLVIAEALAELEPAPEILLVAGAPELRAFPLPPGCDALTLPAIGKDAGGAYSPQRLGTDLGDVLRLRSDVIAAGLRSFDPHLVIVDKVPGGLEGELERALAALTARGRAHVVLGLRDVLDEESAARHEWERSGATRLVERHYDEVWVYGDPSVYDVVGSCDLPLDVRAKTTFTGYVGRRGTPAAGTEPFVLCTVGGGQDGAALARAFAATPLPAGSRGILVAGPHLPAEERQRLHAVAAVRGDLEIRDFAADCQDLIASASAVVAMAGYNTTVELLAAGVPALLVPRVHPRLEQDIRARHLAARGLVDRCHPARVTPRRLASWLRSDHARPPRPRDRPVDLEGLARVRALAGAALGSRPRPHPQEVRDVAV